MLRITKCYESMEGVCFVWFIWTDCIQMTRYFWWSELLPNCFVNFNTICLSALKMGEKGRYYILHIFADSP